MRRRDEIAPELRRQVGAGSDLIKLWDDNCSDRTLVCAPAFTRDEIALAAAETHRLGRRLAVHAYHAAGARDAVLAGADSLEHAVDLDPDTLEEMARRGTVYVPTIDHNRYYAEQAGWFGYTPAEVQALDAYRARNLETTRSAHRAGVDIAMGSDAVFTMFGQNTRELMWLVEAGMTPLEALKAATFTAARSVGREQEYGSVAPGFHADLIAVEGDPRTDIEVVVGRVRGVLVEGLLAP